MPELARGREVAEYTAAEGLVAGYPELEALKEAEHVAAGARIAAPVLLTWVRAWEWASAAGLAAGFVVGSAARTLSGEEECVGVGVSLAAACVALAALLVAGFVAVVVQSMGECMAAFPFS